MDVDSRVDVDRRENVDRRMKVDRMVDVDRGVDPNGRVDRQKGGGLDRHREVDSRRVEEIHTETGT